MELNYPQKDNGMYILSKDNIEQIAIRVLKESFPQNLENPIPLNTTGFLGDYLGLLVKEKYIGTLESGYLGLTVMGDLAEIPSLDIMYHAVVLEETYGTVLISLSLRGQENKGRRRYTEMHEGAHWLLHKPYYQCANMATAKRYVACRKVEQYSDKKNGDRAWLEWQADSLAASLLMPKDVFYDYAKTAIRHEGAARGYLVEGNQHDRGIFYEVVGDISSKFKVSVRAAQIRMIHLGLIRTQAA